MAESLGDLGERRIIRELLAPRYAERLRAFGDDCASLTIRDVPHGFLVSSTDPCPPPMAMNLGFDDEYYRGWLLATINLSDLAAAGAEPLGLLTSLQLPAEMTISSFERLLDGLDACASAQNTNVLGGNLKERKEIDLSATALGFTEGPPLSRRGAKPGELVAVVGELGEFWAGSLAIRRGLRASDPDDPILANVLTPSPKLQAGIQLRRSSAVSACIDNSDGLYPSLAQLAEASGIGIRLHAESFGFSPEVQTIAEELKVDPIRLALGWGDWQLVATVPRRSADEAGRVARNAGAECHIIGEVVQGEGVQLRIGHQEGTLMPLDSERFSPDSWFSAGLDSYIESMLNDPIISAT